MNQSAQKVNYHAVMVNVSTENFSAMANQIVKMNLMRMHVVSTLLIDAEDQNRFLTVKKL